MDKKKKIIISVVIVLLIIATIAGVTSAYFRFVTNSGTAQTTAGKLDIDYNISDQTLEGLLIPAATRSSSIMEAVTAKLNTGSVPGNLNIYMTPTFITGMPASALMWEVDVIDTSSNVLAHYAGDLTSAVIDTPIKIVDAYPLTTDLVTFNIYIWLNGSRIDNENFSHDNGFSATITADSEEITGEFAPDPNPITDFDYEIGTGVADGYVILKEYIGSSSTVIIPNTYKISDVTYNTAIYIGFGNGSPQSRPTTFKNNTTIVNVTLPSQYMVYYEGTSSSDFSLTNTSMLMLFYRCTNLLSVQNMPSSVTDMYSTFSGCTSLVTAPTIGSSVTNMAGAFSGCTSLVNAPAIPNSVTTIYQIFYGCTSLVNAPTIPSSVTTMYEAFSGCSSLEGTIRINSSNVTIPNAQNFHPFYDTVNNLTVQVPENSTTYTNLNNNKPANVTITTFTP